MLSSGRPDNCDCVAPNLKITEVYTEGGTPDAAYTHDYVEIQNPGSSGVPLAGMTLQYRAPGVTGAATVVVPLAGTMAAGSFDIVGLRLGGANGRRIADVEYNNHEFDLAAAGGTLLIVKGDDRRRPRHRRVRPEPIRRRPGRLGDEQRLRDRPGDSSLVTAATSLSAHPEPSTPTSTPTIHGRRPEPEQVAGHPHGDIAEIQGTGATTPLQQRPSRDKRVVTAAYPSGTGNFSGFYVQTRGCRHPGRVRRHVRLHQQPDPDSRTRRG